ncbi:MAG: AAA family ATPase [Deltaproteobacteria bacterium]|jgi:hypothetical protein|nr:AAA family ATPase [Deltaproteobacteria bacterium]
MTMKEISLNDLPFWKIIDQNIFYVDKTKDIHHLVTRPEKNFFLSRPRRFGKSLLLYTLEELFSGNRKRFKGLWIDQSDYAFPRLPVLFLSLSLDSDSPKILKENLMTDLSEIAEDYNIQQKVKGTTPAIYFGSLIRALSKDSNSEVAVLIDEYDAPVTSQMDDQEVAEANAKILRQFFATLKKPKVLPRIGFTMIIGITRYALTSMDSGPNHLYDISINPDFAGLCGFTLEEFDSLFADRLKSTLMSLKNSGEMDPLASLEDLRAKIFHWYDGYNWGGETRVLNPYSILHFFKKISFDDYWIQSGRPGHLTALIKKRPLDFLQPDLDSILSSELRKSDLNKLATAPVLFHSGYLTVDSVKIVKVKVKGATEPEKLYSFRLPNHEVTRGYYPDYFSVILDLKSRNELKAKAEILQQAFLAKDAEKVSSMFRDFISAFTYYQRPEAERNFHLIVQAILMGMNFTVFSEVPSSKGRLDLSVELPGQVYLIIELKYRSKLDQDRILKVNKILATVARNCLPKATRYKSLSKLASATFDTNKIELILSELDDNESSEDNENFLLAKAALKSIPAKDIDKTLASLVLEKLSRDLIEKELINLGVKIDLSPDSQDLAGGRIDQILTRIAQLALRDITQKDYHGPFRLKAKEFIDLALVIYDHGSQVKAIFGQNTSKVKDPSPKRRKLV